MTLKGVPVLVTGGAGFIGSHLVDALVTAGARVRVLDNLSAGRLENLEKSRSAIEFLEGDIRDLRACADGCRAVQVVFHQAALGSVPRSIADPASSISVNVEGTANLFAAARDAGARRVVYASSSSVYGDSADLPKREGREGRPLSPYALSKHMNEELADVFGRCYRMEFVGLRYFNVYGPRQDPNGPYAAVIPRFFDANLKGEPAVIYGDGEQSRDFTFVDDAVAANLLAARAPAASCGAAYNVGGGARTTVNDLARLVAEAVGGAPQARREPPRAGDVAHSLADLGRSTAMLGYAPAVDLARGLARALEHYRPGSRGSSPVPAVGRNA
jgi:nucleoside-diphosphate-sugar epimerase